MLLIYGASDDLIELAGDISEEFNVDSEEDLYVGCSDGTLLSCQYASGGQWKFTVLGVPRKTVRIWPAPGEGKKHERDNALRIPGYSDLVEIGSPVSWVMVTSEHLRNKV
jgi:hypothetical protein